MAQIKSGPFFILISIIATNFNVFGKKFVVIKKLNSEFVFKPNPDFYD
jgi:hypothetical protein